MKTYTRKYPDLTIDNINKILEEKETILSDKINEFDNKWFNQTVKRNFDEYLKELNTPEIKELKMYINSLSNELRMIQPIIYSKIPDYGDIMSLKRFISSCEVGGFIDYDGYGCYIDKNGMTNIEIYPSDIKNNVIREDFDKIIWFNR